jgi:hypothetical protein
MSFFVSDTSCNRCVASLTPWSSSQAPTRPTIFWNWVLGPVGMLLSIPLTMIVKILLEHSEDLKPIAVLLGPTEE